MAEYPTSIQPFGSPLNFSRAKRFLRQRRKLLLVSKGKQRANFATMSNKTKDVSGQMYICLKQALYSVATMRININSLLGRWENTATMCFSCSPETEVGTLACAIYQHLEKKKTTEVETVGLAQNLFFPVPVCYLFCLHLKQGSI